MKIRPLWLRLAKPMSSAEQGGAAIEYVVISAFATMLAVAAVTFVAETVKGKVRGIEERLGVTFDEEALELLP